MIDAQETFVAQANGRQSEYRLKASEGYELLPGQLVSLDSVQINGEERSAGSYVQDGADVTFLKTENLVDATIPALFGELVNPRKGDKITWTGVYLTIAELYGDTGNYLSRITREHATRPRFQALVASTTATMVQEIGYYSRLLTAFDVDTARGQQLDAVGKWVGIDRQVSVPILNVFFEWDDFDTPTSTGWNYGIWQGRFEKSTKLELLSDDVYRRMIKAKIILNEWNGAKPGLYAAFEAGFGALGLELEITDNQDMTFTLTVNGGASTLNQALLTSGYLPIKPAGMAVDEYVFNE